MKNRALKIRNCFLRYLSFIVDLLIVSLISIVLQIVLMLIFHLSISQNIGYQYGIIFLLYIAYSVILESSTMQSTLGKKVLGFTVIDQNKNQVSFMKSLVRNFSKVISVLPVFMGCMTALFLKNEQAVHDLIANTYVQRKSIIEQIISGWG